MNIEYLTDVLILLSAAVIAVPMFQYIGMGAIPGFLIAGVVIGPSGLGFIESFDEISNFAELGVVLLLFVIGIEINPGRLWKMKELVLGLGSLQVLVTGLVITSITHFFIGTPWEVSLLIGLALSLSSTAFVLQLLSDRKQLSSVYGKPAVAVLLLQDLSVVPLLAFVSLMGTPELTIAEDVFYALLEALVILVLIIAAGRFVLNPLLKQLARVGSPEIFTASALLLVLGSAQGMEHLGLSMAMGAFIAGLLIADSSYRHQIVAEVQPFRGLLLGLFFMSMGMSLNLGFFLNSPVTIFTAVLVLLLVKFLVLWLLARLFGLKQKISVSVALLLAQGGEFALVLFALANGMGILDDTLFQHLLVVVLFSMLATPALEKLAYQLFLATQKSSPVIQEIHLNEEEGAGSSPIILVGFGRMGSNVASIMELMNVPYIGIDRDVYRVERQRAEGKPVFYGDVRGPEVLRAAGAASTPLVIVTINDLEATEKVVSSLHISFPDTPVFARGHDLSNCRDLIAFGANYTVSETLEASAALARAALRHIGSEEGELETVLESYRNASYGQINRDLDS